MTSRQGCQPACRAWAVEGLGSGQLPGRPHPGYAYSPFVPLTWNAALTERAYLGRCSVCGPRGRCTAAHGQRQGGRRAGRWAAAAQQRAQVQAGSSVPGRLLRLGELRQEGGCLAACRHAGVLRREARSSRGQGRPPQPESGLRALHRAVQAAAATAGAQQPPTHEGSHSESKATAQRGSAPAASAEPVEAWTSWLSCSSCMSWECALWCACSCCSSAACASTLCSCCAVSWP